MEVSALTPHNELLFPSALPFILCTHSPLCRSQCMLRIRVMHCLLTGLTDRVHHHWLTDSALGSAVREYSDRESVHDLSVYSVLHNRCVVCTT